MRKKKRRSPWQNILAGAFLIILALAFILESEYRHSQYAYHAASVSFEYGFKSGAEIQLKALQGFYGTNQSGPMQ